MANDYCVGGSALTDFKDDDKRSSNGASSFKERILRELEEANRKHQLEEEAAQKRAEAQRQAEDLRRQHILAEQDLQDQVAKEEQVRLAQAESERKAQELSEENRIQKELQSVLQVAGVTDDLAKSHNQNSQSIVNAKSETVTFTESTSLTMDSRSQSKEQSNSLSASVSEAASLHSEEIREGSSLATSSLPSDSVSVAAAKTSDQLESELSIEAINEAVVAQVEAKEITEVKSQNMTRRKKNHKIAAKITGILVTVILVVALLTAFLGYRYVSSALGAVDKSSKKFVTVEIPAGSGNKLIGQILEKNGLIKNGSIFNYYTRFKNVSDLQSGYYNLQKSMTVEDIINTLQQGGTSEPQEPVSGKILITEGYTIDQIAKAITTNVNTKKATKTPYSEKDFLALMKDKAFIAQMVKKYPKLLAHLPSADKARYQLEGYLFPATYNYYEGLTLKELVDQMLSTMNTNLSPYYDKIAASGRSVNDILTLASLVEKEGSTDDDRRNIASVFYNRLNAQMPLQSNIAVLYAMGKLGQSTTLQEDAAIDTKIKSPYNIYENLGLMPGPVDSPGLSAIEATVSPANTNNLYFVADVTTGNVYYAEDYATHEANVAKYVNAHLTSSSNSSE